MVGTLVGIHPHKRPLLKKYKIRFVDCCRVASGETGLGG